MKKFSFFIQSKKDKFYISKGDKLYIDLNKSYDSDVIGGESKTSASVSPSVDTPKTEAAAVKPAAQTPSKPVAQPATVPCKNCMQPPEPPTGAVSEHEVVGAIHRFPHMNAKDFSGLSTSSNKFGLNPKQKEHLKNNMFEHFEPEHHQKLREMAKTVAQHYHGKFHNTINPANYVAGYDADEALEQFTDRLVQLMNPHVRVGRTDNRSPEKKKATADELKKLGAENDITEDDIDEDDDSSGNLKEGTKGRPKLKAEHRWKLFQDIEKELDLVKQQHAEGLIPDDKYQKLLVEYSVLMDPQNLNYNQGVDTSKIENPAHLRSALHQYAKNAYRSFFTSEYRSNTSESLSDINKDIIRHKNAVNDLEEKSEGITNQLSKIKESNPTVDSTLNAIDKFNKRQDTLLDEDKRAKNRQKEINEEIELLDIEPEQLANTVSETIKNLKDFPIPDILTTEYSKLIGGAQNAFSGKNNNLTRNVLSNLKNKLEFFAEKKLPLEDKEKIQAAAALIGPLMKKLDVYSKFDTQQKRGKRKAELENEFDHILSYQDKNEAELQEIQAKMQDTGINSPVVKEYINLYQQRKDIEAKISNLLEYKPSSKNTTVSLDAPIKDEAQGTVKDTLIDNKNSLDEDEFSNKELNLANKRKELENSWGETLPPHVERERLTKIGSDMVDLIAEHRKFSQDFDDNGEKRKRGYRHYLFGDDELQEEDLKEHKKLFPNEEPPNVRKVNYGLFHVASNLLISLGQDEKVQKFIDDFVSKNPARVQAVDENGQPKYNKQGEPIMKVNEKVPDLFVSGDQKEAKGLWHTVAKMSPPDILKYSILFSDYNPVPMGPEDVYENEGGVFDPLNKIINSDVNTSESSKKQRIQNYFFTYLRRIGNAAIDSATQNDPKLSKIFKQVKSLNQKDKQSHHTYPAELRRDLLRIADKLYMQTYKQVPQHYPHKFTGSYSDWKEKYNKLLPLDKNEQGKAKKSFSADEPVYFVNLEKSLYIKVE